MYFDQVLDHQISKLLKQNMKVLHMLPVYYHFEWLFWQTVSHQYIIWQTAQLLKCVHHCPHPITWSAWKSPRSLLRRHGTWKCSYGAVQPGWRWDVQSAFGKATNGAEERGRDSTVQSKTCVCIQIYIYINYEYVYYIYTPGTLNNRSF